MSSNPADNHPSRATVLPDGHQVPGTVNRGRRGVVIVVPMREDARVNRLAREKVPSHPAPKQPPNPVVVIVPASGSQGPRQISGSDGRR